MVNIGGGGGGGVAAKVHLKFWQSTAVDNIKDFGHIYWSCEQNVLFSAFLL